ncbi:glycosyltransferase [Sinimarinibacterium sp. CAU 1509]|uniref:glycosyltransferase n=1 Tax=Sinimarinibacterium sp. CAU 1509 TaxID=2562283 RepID=UPI0010AD494A|nr:glycosyltransferase [Sinimarinibacterium sp. CAU 1509]TJY59328.1 glycosyltransferase [Sinimarinibacterium sp. CAU 1509]
MRSLHLIASLNMGGAENSFVRAVRALSNAGHITAAAVRPSSALVAALGTHTPRYDVSLRNYADLSSVLRIRRLLRDEDFPVVQTWASRATWLTHAPRGVAHVARLGGRYRLFYFRHAHAWVVNTRGLREWMISRGFPAHAVTHIDNFVPSDPAPPPFSRADLGIPDDVLLTVALGRLVVKKGFQDLLEAMAQLPRSVGGREHHLLLMGDGVLRESLVEQITRLGLGDRVHLTGWVDRAAAALALGDVMVCPSRIEPLGNVILEAWNKGLPVVSTRSDGGSELIDDRDNGLLCDVADPAALARSWSEALSDQTLREHIAGRGLERFRARFSERATVDAYVNLYQRLARGQARVPESSSAR